MGRSQYRECRRCIEYSARWQCLLHSKIAPDHVNQPKHLYDTFERSAPTMSSRKPHRTSTAAADASGLQTLLALPLCERREAVARDLRRQTPQFNAIPAHDLADALGVPEPWRPGGGWSFTRYAPIVSVEEYARDNSPASELVYMIEKTISAERFQQLLKHSESLDDSENPSFPFLTKVERSRLEQAIAEEQMEANASNGMNCIASCSVASESGAVLEFEGDVEDDGTCIDLRTPYDQRAKRFKDLSRCLTSCW